MFISCDEGKDEEGGDVSLGDLVEVVVVFRSVSLHCGAPDEMSIAPAPTLVRRALPS